MRCILALTMLLGLSACAPAIPPHMSRGERVPLVTAERAKVVFLWPDNSCERGGYYTVATDRGRFVGNLYTGTRLEAELEPGPVNFFAFNPLVEEATGQQTSAEVATLRAELEPGRTYFVRFAFGEWNERGPVRPHWLMTRAGARQYCSTHEAALIALTPAQPEWERLREWLDDLEPLRSTGGAGDQWLRADPLTVETHLALARQREHRYWPAARALATLRATDGVHVVTEASPSVARRDRNGQNIATLTLSIRE